MGLVSLGSQGRPCYVKLEKRTCCYYSLSLFFCSFLNKKCLLLTLSFLQTLKSCGWDVVGCYGGSSMVAKPSAYLGKTLELEGYRTKLSSSNIREAVLRATGLCINSESWTGIPDYCRFTVALTATDFEMALKCISLFKNLVLGS